MSITITFITICFTILSSLSSIAQEKHIGLWKGVDQGEVGYINLDTTGFAYFIFENDTMGGESFMLDGIEASVRYEINYAATPHTIDFMLVVKGSDSVIRTLPGIFKMMNDDQLVISLDFVDEQRPRTFEEGDRLQLDRVMPKAKKE